VCRIDSNKDLSRLHWRRDLHGGGDESLALRYDLLKDQAHINIGGLWINTVLKLSGLTVDLACLAYRR
jgi:hypothetical protein